MGKKHEINEGDTHEPLLEWTDNTNRLLGYIQENLVRSHKLRYRRLVLLIGDESGHLLFRLHNDNCLALPVLRDMPAGRSFADVASETLLAEGFSPYNQLQDLGYLPSQGLEYELRIYHARIAHCHLERKTWGNEPYLLLDCDELKGLEHQLSLEDLLHTLLQHKILAPFWQRNSIGRVS
ncbi:MAG: hypothetical protein IKN64_10735 [Desulfovibrio sp.]|nr:hypothetical protein [Desulfovibrio sp.]